MDTLPSRTKALSPPPWRGLPVGLMAPLLGVAFAVLLQFYAKRVLGDYAAKVLLDIGISIILAVSLNIVNGFAGQFSIGHAGFMAVGAYSAGFLMYYGSMLLWPADVTALGPAAHGGFLSWTEAPAQFFAPGGPGMAGFFHWGDLYFLGALLAGGLVAAVFGLVVGLPSLRLRGDYLAIVTLGFGEIVRSVLESSKDLVTDLDQVRHTSWAELTLHLGSASGLDGQPLYTTLFWAWSFAILTVLVAFRIKTSTFGRAFLAIRENEIAAEAVGVPTTRYKVRAFVIAAFFAGVAGGLYAHEPGNSVAPDAFGFMKSFDIIIMVVLGGMGSISGSVLAATLLTILPEWLRQPTHLWPVGLGAVAILLVLRRGRPSRMVFVLAVLTILFEVIRSLSVLYHIDLSVYRMLLYALALILMMILRPQGFFGVYEVWDVRHLWRGVRQAWGVPGAAA